MARYKLKERWISIGDDYWIEDEDGRQAVKVDGKALRIRKTLWLEDAEGRKLCKLQERKLRVRDSMEIEDPDGKRIAMVRKALITPLRERWTVDLGDRELKVKGNILDHDYEVKDDGETVAEVSKKWLRMRDTYGIEIAEGQDDVMLLAVAVAVDVMAHDIADGD